MDPVSGTTAAQSIKEVNDLLKFASKANTEAATKMIKVTTEMKLSANSNPGYGAAVDCYA